MTAPTPELAQQVTTRILELVNKFNLETRQSQAGEERRFVEGRMTEARGELRKAEADLASFLSRNAQFTHSPLLALEHDRLEREVAWRQQVFTTLAQSYEQARIEEVRNIPVITVLEPATFPVRPNGRGSTRWGMMGIVAGLMLAVVLAFCLEFFRQSDALEAEKYQEFARLRRETLQDLRRPWRLRRPARRAS